jgi:hypothetical protein
LKGGMGDDLNAYNEVMGIFFHIKSALYLLLTKKIQSIIPLHQKLSNKSEIILELVRKLIEKSKESLKSGNNPNSMLDFMVQSHFDGEMSQEELEGNVFIFFLAGHETYVFKHSKFKELQNLFLLLFNCWRNIQRFKKRQEKKFSNFWETKNVLTKPVKSSIIFP